MLCFKKVSYRYPSATAPTLSAVGFSLSPAEHVVLLGSNGSGKSTLARLANGLLLPEQGRVLVDGMQTGDRSTIRALRSRVGLVAQDADNQIVSTSVLDEVAFGPENLGLERTEILRRCTDALAALGLDGLEARDPNTLSGGQKQRLVLAGILAMDPAYLVLDEPTSMLDSKGRSEVRRALHGLHARGHAIVHITHDLGFARDADRALVLKAGRLVFDGAPEALLADEGLLLAYGLMVRGEDELGEKRPEEGPATARPGEKTRAGGSAALPGTPAAQASLRLEGVGFSYGHDGPGGDGRHEVLKGIDFVVDPQSHVLVTGDSGSGKSTLLRILAGLLEPTVGAARLAQGAAGRIVPGSVGLVFQHPESQLFAQTVADEVAFGPENLGLVPSRALRDGAVREALEAVGLDPEDFGPRSPFMLSGGEMRRVAIAGVLAMRPPFLLLDEPTAGLDAAGRAFVHALMRRLAQAGTGVVVVSHDVEEFRPHARTHFELREGRLWRR
ncbi:MAG: ATP-binding cassette domain-containing protein [Coriobacteriales bacterium]|jgi:energy-coupling factor transport system ATP-binding protein|nr:ATP-binding cassette domain-containing protein [Coriobacteriales bacterium]